MEKDKINKYCEILLFCKDQVSIQIDSVFQFKLSQVKQWVSEAIDQLNNVKEQSDWLKLQALSNLVEKYLKNTLDECNMNIKKLIKNYKFTEDLQFWYKQKRNQGFSASQIYNELVQNLPKIQNKGKNINSMNEFMLYLSMILQQYLEQIFKEMELYQDYHPKLKQLLAQVNDSIIDGFKINHEFEYIQIISYIEQIQNTINKDVTQMNLISNDDIFFMSSPAQKCEDLRKIIFNQYQQYIKQEFNIKDRVYSYLFKKEIKKTQKKSDEKVYQIYRELKSYYIQEKNNYFNQIMEQLPLDTIIQTFSVQYSQSKNKLKKEQIGAFLIQNINIKSLEDIQILNQVFSQFFDKEEYLQKIFSDIRNQKNFDYCNLLLQSFSFEMSPQYNMFFKEMKTILNENLLMFYKYLTFIYMTVTNIEATKSGKLVINPFYGCYYSYRVQVLQDIQKKLEFDQATYFFNFLDVYFESNFIFPYILNKTKINKTLEIMLTRASNNYEILKQIRLESKQDDKIIKGLFNQQIKDIQKQYKYKDVPDHMYLVKVSEKVKSRNIIIAISGFTSEAENKKEKWQDLAQIYPNSEIYSIEYKSCADNDLKLFGVQSIFELILSIAYKGVLGFGISVIKLLVQNPFLKAWVQADLVGLYLAHLIHNNKIFPDSSLSLIGFSLGTQVIQSCLYHYKQLIAESNTPSQIASVCFFGGVANINYILQQNLTSCISYKLFNCFTNKDKVLRIILKLAKMYSDPVGLNAITDATDKIINHDFSHQINGHQKIFENHASVIQQIDFRQEQLGSFNEQNLNSFLALTQSQMF